MRIIAAVIFAMALVPATAAWAQNPPPAAQASLNETFHDVVHAPSRHVENHIGDVVITNGKTQIRVAYLPMLPPLSGSAIGVTQKLPNPFELTNTPIAMSRRQWERK